MGLAYVVRILLQKREAMIMPTMHRVGLQRTYSKNGLRDHLAVSLEIKIGAGGRIVPRKFTLQSRRSHLDIYLPQSLRTVSTIRFILSSPHEEHLRQATYKPAHQCRYDSRRKQFAILSLRSCHLRYPPHHSRRLRQVCSKLDFPTAYRCPNGAYMISYHSIAIEPKPKIASSCAQSSVESNFLHSHLRLVRIKLRSASRVFVDGKNTLALASLVNGAPSLSPLWV